MTMEALDSRSYPSSTPVAIMHEPSQELIPVDMGPEGGHAAYRDKGRFKEKYQGMREQFDKAMRDNEMIKQQLAHITKKAQLLSDENTLLLDHILINDGGIAQKWLPQGPPRGYPPGSEMAPEPRRRTPPPGTHLAPGHDNPSLRRSRRLSHSNVATANGNGGGSHHHPSNGRRDHRVPPEQARAAEYGSMGPPQPYERPLEFIPHDANGRA
ncbi:hypothetical protein BKA70DRAFT_1253617 [Coprinopsis sp. MPI-PUGE-AT-0042]|nr:hypothetical protein BKA70DRAFT_1253617 [Coprinopsis sp. MPI-PUGE-AT-0042]